MNKVIEMSKGTYRVACDCGDPRCDVIIEVKRHPGSQMREVTWVWMDAHVSTFNHLTKPRWLYWAISIWRRLKYATKILFSGHLEFHKEFVIRDDDHLRQFIECLQGTYKPCSCSKEPQKQLPYKEGGK